MRRDRQFKTGFNDGGRDRIVPAARAERRDFALIVAVRIAEPVLRQPRMVEFRLRQIRHGRILFQEVDIMTGFPSSAGPVNGRLALFRAHR